MSLRKASWEAQVLTSLVAAGNTVLVLADVVAVVGTLGATAKHGELGRMWGGGGGGVGVARLVVRLRETR
jgi:hypothetical protein